MKERPILFNDEMVRAILYGRKTQTRRVCQGQRELSCAADFQIDRCPYGQPGDRLWVREAWCMGGTGYDEPPNDGRPRHCGGGRRCFYRATEPDVVHEDDASRSPWRPSIHMPRWMSRIGLDVVSVRVERVQEISHADCMAEGVRIYTFEATGDHPRMYGFITDADGPDEHGTAPHHTAQDAYAKLWDSINAKRGHSWESNPWVWVVEFLRVKP